MTGKEMAAAVADVVRRVTAALATRVEALETALASLPAGPKGDPGDRGEKGEPGDSITGEKGDRGDAGEPGRDGANGVGERGEKGDTGLDGRDGHNGERGDRGPAGESVDLSTVILALQPQIKSFLEAIPAPSPPALSDVVSALEPSVETALAKWALDFERRAQDTLQRAVDRLPVPRDGKDGEPGENGIDGMGFDDLIVEHDGERSFTIKLVRGNQVKDFSFTIPAVIDRGFWKEGTKASAGDGMTSGGSYWIAQKDTTTKPEIGNSDWRLTVRKGRDGKDAIQ